MPWQVLEIQTDNEQAVLLSEILLAYNALSVSIEDPGIAAQNASAVFAEWGKPLAPLWDQCLVKAVFPATTDLPQLTTRIQTALGWQTFPQFKITMIQDQDWVRAFQEELHPMAVTDTLWIIPSGQTPPYPAAINIMIDPGLAFGSGTHPTTRLCLQWLARHIRGRETVVDYGCGSGILAIAALKLGAKRAVGIDIDPQGLLASTMNAGKNKVSLELYLPPEAPSIQADFLVANILANPLQELAAVLAGSVRPGGKIALSGIIDEQAAEIGRIYSRWFTMQKPVTAGEWVLLEGIRNN